MKTNKSTAPKSTELTDAPKSKVSTLNPDFIMKSDNSINSTNAVNATNSVNSDNTVNSTTPANADNLFDNEQIPAEVTETTEPPKQQRIGKQQRKSDFAEFKATFLAPAKLVNRHALNIEGDLWDQLERVSRILGDRGTTVSSYANAIIAEHLKQYIDDIEIWRKL
ncbi:DUF3408 domain-containing protein, partial [uncultured Bacteroides sp.]|uniref:DUF3408 domain-containing protein n=1 Tax=uncultured Bacteroides sp. TaxID=162156 RepID=UPI00266F65A8